MLNRLLCLFGILLYLSACQPIPMNKQLPFDLYPSFEGNDLGLQFSPQQSVFKMWSPQAEAVRLNIYDQGLGANLISEHPFQKDEQGTWVCPIDKDLEGKFYTYQIKYQGNWLTEAVDPYAVAVGVNGLRAQVIDLNKTDPSGWAIDQKPSLPNLTDAIIYELHVRDISNHPSSGINARGKYLGLVEPKRTSPEGYLTGLDHFKELGITHVHLLPSFDHRSIDETRLEEPQFNWGYDPQNYNVPEGSYASDPYDGSVRIREFKTMVQGFHEAGIGVILDVVYNHTGLSEKSHLNLLAPGYYYRQKPDGSFSDASACGNETASDRYMMRKYMIESIEYWMKEYHIDGFRFDLMGIHDVETMNAISKAARAIDPKVLLYGEGWTAGDSPLPVGRRALKAHTHQLEGIAAFSDDLRDAIKGHVFTKEAPGFIGGKTGLKESIKFGVVASTWHPQIDYAAVNYSDSAWAKDPVQTISYASCHDNHTLWDKLAISRPDATEEERRAMHKLGLAIVLTSQGIPFLHAGSEMLRTKQGEENSYNAPDSINNIDWAWKAENYDVFEYVQGLIKLRKTHPAFRIKDAGVLRQNLTFLESDSESLVGFQLGPHANGDPWTNIIVGYNGSDQNQVLVVPPGKYTQVVDGNQINLRGINRISGNKVLIPPYSAAVLFTENINATE